MSFTCPHAASPLMFLSPLGERLGEGVKHESCLLHHIALAWAFISLIVFTFDRKCRQKALRSAEAEKPQASSPAALAAHVGGVPKRSTNPSCQLDNPYS